MAMLKNRGVHESFPNCPTVGLPNKMLICAKKTIRRRWPQRQKAQEPSEPRLT